MRFATFDGKRARPTPKLRGLCPSCAAEVVAKCGRHVVWHWAHLSRVTCDAWWENETEWHRNWKDRFPEEWQEVICVDNTSGEKHIADIQAPSGLTVEFQHSPISSTEVASRESFYGNLLWVVDGCRNELDPNFFRLSLSKPVAEGTNEFPLRWWGPSKLFANWATATKLVYFDFGHEDILWRLLHFDRATKAGAVKPYGRKALVTLWAEASYPPPVGSTTSKIAVVEQAGRDDLGDA